MRRAAMLGMLMLSLLVFGGWGNATAATPFDTAKERGWLTDNVAPGDEATVELFSELLSGAEGEARGRSVQLDTTYSGSLEREDAAYLLQQFAGWEDVFAPYIDVPAEAQEAGAIGALTQRGILQGLPNGTFGYGKTLTASQAATLVTRYYETIKPVKLQEATIQELQNMLENGQLTSVELVDFYLDRIQRYDQKGPALNSIITINEEARGIAAQLDKERAMRGVRGPLHGIPILAKDNFDTAGMPTTAGCICLAESIPPNDAHQIKLLKEAGAIILGKTNLHEFAVGYTTSGSMLGQTLNPYDLQRYPGGSSGGTGAAVAANFAVAGLGSDTGGSIRVPSSMNSLVGIRPTVGLSSRDGIIPLALTQDVGGPMARTVTDAAILLEATVGYDANDPVTAWSDDQIPSSYLESLQADGLIGKRIGLLTQLMGDNTSVAVKQVMNQAIVDMEALGAEVVPITLSDFDDIMSYSSLSGWEFKFQLNDYLESLGEEAPYSSLTEIIEADAYDPAIEGLLKARDSRKSLNEEEYKDVVLFRTKLTQEALLTAMAKQSLDAFVYPTSSHPAALIGEEQLVGTNVLLSSFSGFPAITVPAGFTAKGLPVGIEFMARKFEEPVLLNVAYSYEQGTLHRRSPVLLP
ncbi:amidase family protein [Aureibacillus halotolerans]|uniref:Asp-tRNA(Asn)/Glu-tRNA(Gln) amidotransferase A subunit family amidase n=1 Tax=Aureibacillus halotolerans TaxID=1508390 RepID=A0A4R6TUG7_9BACI|nr:amidase family protein [Aureibacillus halotolerans]TDQ36786.1 Asp-tRNA(Asn)/Glu-tRNA(Gln) amidotransferase A subunit family amidase [Aureibacillus halotolerans]